MSCSSAPAAAEAPASSESAEGKPYDDLIKFPDDPGPPPEVWEIEAKYEWEKDERGYIFEQRLEGAEAHKTAGNAAFHANEWEVALRRYKRAIYFCHFDELQMHDLMDHHKEQAHGIQVSCKLNLANCIAKMSAAERVELDAALPEGSLDQAVVAVNEVIKIRPKEPKGYYRRGQIQMLQQDLPGARESLNEAAKLGGGRDVRAALVALRALEKAEGQRARQLYGGVIQPQSLHALQEADAARLAARWATLWACVRLGLYPIIRPIELLDAAAGSPIARAIGRAWAWCKAWARDDHE